MGGGSAKKVRTLSPAPRIARDPELQNLLVTDPAALRIVDDVADHGQRCFEHFLFTFPVSHRNRCCMDAIQLGITDSSIRFRAKTVGVVEKALGVDNEVTSATSAPGRRGAR